MQDLDLEIREGGGRLQKKCFQPFGSQFGLKIKGGRVPRAPPLDPPLYLVGASEEERHPRRPRGSKSGQEKRRDKI